MTGPWLDFLIFEWVLLTGSTTAGSDCLLMPQSTVSRRFRSFATQHHIEVRRHGNSYSILSGSDYVEQLRLVFARYRSLTGHYIWAIRGPFDYSVVPKFLPGIAIALDDQLYMNYSRLLDNRLLDIVYSPDYLDPADGLPFISSEYQSADNHSCLKVLQFRANLKNCFLDPIQNV